MNGKVEIIEGFHTVKYFREIKEKISEEIIHMTHDEMCEYLGQAPEKGKSVKEISSKNI
jgi:hypothetical protein